mmetsp:Transcript_13367/g.36757  ORF Transcript_13367/g.36757 Transcript_13367/m.36757 type:complete len:205 (-) Transcript_13367:439-1053(-)
MSVCVQQAGAVLSRAPHEAFLEVVTNVALRSTEGHSLSGRLGSLVFLVADVRGRTFLLRVLLLEDDGFLVARHGAITSSSSHRLGSWRTRSGRSLGFRSCRSGFRSRACLGRRSGLCLGLGLCLRLGLSLGFWRWRWLFLRLLCGRRPRRLVRSGWCRWSNWSGWSGWRSWCWLFALPRHGRWSILSDCRRTCRRCSRRCRCFD